MSLTVDRPNANRLERRRLVPKNSCHLVQIVCCVHTFKVWFISDKYMLRYRLHNLVAGGWVEGGFLQEIISHCGSILKAGICQIFNLAENPRWIQVWRHFYTKLKEIFTRCLKPCLPLFETCLHICLKHASSMFEECLFLHNVWRHVHTISQDMFTIHNMLEETIM